MLGIDGEEIADFDISTDKRAKRKALGKYSY